jgi:ABC-type uncharacterized transport system permease subunit
MITSNRTIAGSCIRFVNKTRATAAMEASSISGEGALFLVRWLLRLLRTAALIGIWSQLGAHKLFGTGASVAQLGAYTVISEALGDLLRMRTGMEMAFFNGSVALRFLRPFGILQQFAAECLGRAALGGICFGLPLVAGAALCGMHLAPVSAHAFIWFSISLPLAVATGLALEYLLIGVGTVYGFHPYTINNVREAAFGVLSGAFIPLALLPKIVARFAEVLPFASQAAAPLEIYTGLGNPGHIVSLQIFWTVTLWIATAVVWRWNREKLVLYAGG